MKLKKILSSNAPAAVILIRLMVGLIFLSEGAQKFLFPLDLGIGRFAKLGIPSPDFFAPFTGGFETICGLLLLLGLLTRVAAIPLLIIMLVAFVTVRVPEFEKSGFW
jgi:putative oxidoreductase